MTFPARLHAIFSTIERHTKPPIQIHPSKELKIPMHSSPNPADGPIGFKLMHQQITMLNTEAHPPFHKWTDTITKYIS